MQMVKMSSERIDNDTGLQHQIKMVVIVSRF